MHPRTGGDPGCLDLGGHASGTDAGATGPAEDHPGEVGVSGDVAEQRGVPAARVTVIEPLDVGEQHEQVCVEQVRDQGGEPVVVADPDLVGGHGVVLVDHREDAELEQAVEGPLGVAVVRPTHHVVGGEQHLPDGDAVPGERLRVAVHQDALTDARCCLLGGQVARTSREPERHEPGRDGARGHQDDLVPGCPMGCQRIDQGVDGLALEPHSGRSSATTTRP